MTVDEYLYSVIQNNRNSIEYSSKEQDVFNNLQGLLWSNYRSIFDIGYFSNFQLNICQSGSRAKGTAIKGNSDIDIFLSIYDPNNIKTLEEYFNMTYSFLNENFKSVRKQNVSIGLEYCGFDIDIVPAKRVNSMSFSRFNDHYLWSNKKKARMLTNIQKHISIVQGSSVKDEVILAKIWRKKYNIDIPSIYLELLVINALENQMIFSIGKKFTHILRYIKDNITDKKIVDPANSNNIISDTLNDSEKMAIKKIAQQAINAKYWEEIV